MCIHQRVPNKCIHILRDVIYVKCVYIFLAPSVFIGTRNVSKQISTKSEIRIFYSVHFCFLRLKGLRHKQKGVQAS